MDIEQLDEAQPRFYRYVVWQYNGGCVSIEVSIALQAEGLSAIGRERVTLLQAVAREGSISAAARAVGLSYKAAWDALNAMSNLFGAQLLTTRSGGAIGGGAALTPAGVRVIEAYGRLEAEMARLVRDIGPELAEAGITPFNLMTGFFMRTSARNALRGTIETIRADALNSEVGVRISHDTLIYALVTNQSVRDLGLCAGRQAIVLIKAPFVMVALDDGAPATSARNAVPGVVQRCETSELSAEIVIDIGASRTIAASISAASARALKIKKGSRVQAIFDSSHVIVAVD